MSSSFESITLGDLSGVHGGKSLAARAVSGMQACLAIPPQSSNSQEACVQEQRRRYYRVTALGARVRAAEVARLETLLKNARLRSA